MIFRAGGGHLFDDDNIHSMIFRSSKSDKITPPCSRDLALSRCVVSSKRHFVVSVRVVVDFLISIAFQVDKGVVQIGNKTIVWEKEDDPPQLRSPSAGKRVSSPAEDGGRVRAGAPCAETRGS